MESANFPQVIAYDVDVFPSFGSDALSSSPKKEGKSCS